MSLNQDVKTKALLVHHNGVINENIITSKGNEIREIFRDDIFLSRKIFSIYMELIQNIFYYSCEKAEINGHVYGVGGIQISKEGNNYIIKSRNLAEKQFVDNICSKFPKINQLNKEQLRKLKIETRRKPQEPLSKGAGIGLIQLAIISGNPLNIFFEQKDNTHSFYNIHVKVCANS